MQSTKQFIKTIILASIIGLAVSYVFAWTGPTAPPPGGNTSAPVNVGSTLQMKSGGLGINGLLIGYSQALFALNSGNVGVGIDTPIEKLDVVGGRIKSDTGFCIGTSCITSWPAGGGGGLPSGLSGQTLRHDGTNWVANSNIFNSGTSVSVGPQDGANEGGEIIFMGAGTNKYFYLDNYAGRLRFISQGPPDTEKMTMLNNGNVGIGTSAPTRKLDVSGSIATGGNLYRSMSGSDVYGVGEYDLAVSENPGKNISGVGWDASSGLIGFIVPNGNTVGVYAPTGTANFEVSGDLKLGKNIYRTKSGIDVYGVGEYDLAVSENPGKYIYGVGWQASTGLVGFMVPTGGTVGIYGSAGAANFDVTGSLKYRAGSTSVRMSNVYPTYYEFVENDSSSWGVTKWASSKRFKENIIDLEIDSSKIYDLNPVSFNWKPERGGHRDFGLIAEETAEILPELVAYGEDGKPFSVRYELVSILLLDELKKKNNEIKVLNETVGQLKIRIEKLEQKI